MLEQLLRKHEARRLREDAKRAEAHADHGELALAIAREHAAHADGDDGEGCSRGGHLWRQRREGSARVGRPRRVWTAGLSWGDQGRSGQEGHGEACLQGVVGTSTPVA